MSDEFGLPWFARDLTDLVHPITPGRLYVVLAPTGSGKTVFGLNLLAHLFQLDPAVPVIAAVTEETCRYYDLLACRAAAVSYADHFYNRLGADERTEVARWETWYREGTHLTVLPQRHPRLADVLEAFDQHDPPMVLLVDHLHCLNRQGEALPAFLDAAAECLAQVASRSDCAVILMAQVHRPQGRDPLYAYRIPTPTSGLGSSKIEQAADVLLGVSRKLRDDVPKDAMARLAKGFLRRGESVRDYEEAHTARVTVLKHRMDDEACRRSILLTVHAGKMQDRLALAVNDDRPPF